MRRKLFYAAVLLVFAAAVALRARMAERDAAREIVSIYGEWRNNGIPVVVRRLEPGALTSVTKISGVVDERGAVRAVVTPAMAKEIREGQRFDGCGSRPLSGVIKSVAARPDLITGLHRVLLKTDGGNPLAPGTIIVACAASPGERALLLPREAVEAGSVSVWAVLDGKAILREVELGSSDGSFYEVLSGLSEGDLVAVDGWRSLEEGDRVRFEDGGRP